MANEKASDKPFCVDTYKCKDDNRPRNMFLELSVHFGYKDCETRIVWFLDYNVLIKSRVHNTTTVNIRYF